MKKITITIGIPVFNEEQNIEGFLMSLLDQTMEKTILQEILVYSDNSTDKTNAIIKKLEKKHPIIKGYFETERKVKYFRVNEMFRKNKSDILVILDADIALV